MNENSYYYARATEDIKFAMICTLIGGLATPISVETPARPALAGLAVSDISKNEYGFFALTEEAFNTVFRSKEYLNL